MTTKQELQQVRDALRITLLTAKFGTPEELGEFAYGYMQGIVNDLQKQLATIDSIIAGADGWLPIESAPEGKNVLVWYKGGVEVAWRYGIRWQLDTKPIESPTHWMPLPAAPKHGGEE